MGLIDILDKVFFGKEALNRWAKERAKKDTDLTKEEKEEYDDGPFHIKREFTGDSTSYFNKKEKTIEGKVIRILGEKNTETFFLLETPKGNAEIGFPKTFSEEILSKIENQTIKYCQKEDHYSETYPGTPSGGCDSISTKYRIEVLDGSLKGRYFQEERGN